MSGITTKGHSPGLDLSTAKEWIYPTNYPVRDYQKNIVSKALFQNTLVSLPTGLGKTFIAAVVMYNFNRWYPHHKIIFMAHSKPLVAQQVDACCHIMGIPKSVTAELNGNIACNARKQHWESKQIFFLTPQVFNNDLTRGLVSAESICCVVIDEAHKALGNQAFCQSIRALQPFNKNFRVLALSATPGDDISMVKNVIENLLISHLELRTDEDSDIKKYLHEKKVEAVVVTLDSKIIEYKNQLLQVAEKYLKQLVQMKAIGSSFGSMSSFSLVLKQKQFIANPSVGSEQRGLVLSNFSVVISLYKALEELVVHGLRSFHNKLLIMKTGEGSTSNAHHRLSKDGDFIALLDSVEKYIGQDKDIAFDPNVSMARLQDELDAQLGGRLPPVVYSHPKFVMLEQIIVQHFECWKEKDESTRVIVFCKSRPCTGEICNFLNRYRPLIRPMVLIGQSHANGGSTSRGLKQSSQLEVMRKFRGGTYNTLVATCVGEEGLDVGEVDLIVNFDATKNSNTQVQRSGRTGRKRDGRVVNLLTEGKEYQDYNVAIARSKNITKKLSNGIKMLPLYPDSPRLLPDDIHPVCEEMFLKPVSDVIKNIAINIGECPKSKKKKVISKKHKKVELTSSQLTDPKYDIRYAMSKAKEKGKAHHDDTSDTLFESEGAVGILKTSNKSLKRKQVVCTSQKDIDLIILDDSPRKNISSVLKSSSEPSVLSFLSEHVSIDSLNSKMCDELDRLSISDLLLFVSENESSITMPKKYQNYEGNALVLVSGDPSEFEFDFEYKDIELPVQMASDLPTSLTNWDSSPFINEFEIALHKKSPAEVHSIVEVECNVLPGEGITPLSKTAMSPKVNSSMVTVTQAISMIASLQRNQVEAKKTVMEGESDKLSVHHSNQINPLFEAKTKVSKNAIVSRSPSPTVLDFSKDSARECSQIFRDHSCNGPFITLPAEVNKTEVNVCAAPTPLKLPGEYLSSPLVPPTPSSPVLNISTQRLMERCNSSKILRERSLNRPPISIPPETEEMVGNSETSHLDERILEENSGSPSFVSFWSFSKPEKSNVKKSLNFYEGHQLKTHKPIKSSLGVLNLDSDDDIFADDEKIREIFTKTKETDKSRKNDIVNKPKTPQPVHKSRTPQTAIVRPMGFENHPCKNDTGWISVSKKPKELSVIALAKSSIKKKRYIKEQNSLDSFVTCNELKVNDQSDPDSNTKKDSSNISLSTFDCIPDDLVDFLDDTSFHNNPHKSTPAHRLAANERTQFQSYPDTSTPKHTSILPNRDITNNREALFDDELSDGALEAIKAVENYERNLKIHEKSADASIPSDQAVFNLWSSDDSADLFEKSASKGGRTRKSPAKPNKKENKKPKKASLGRKKKNPFVDDEADLSNGSSAVSSDEENTSGLDDMDSSFLDERLAPTQAPDVDMTARYLATVRSPRIVAGAFKIPHAVRNDIAVFSQVDHNDDDYAYDSFCVGDDTEFVNEELSELELAELALEKKKKRRRKQSPLLSTVNKRRKKRRRIITADSSSDDETNVVSLTKTNNSILRKPGNNDECDKSLIRSDLPNNGIVINNSSVSLISKLPARTDNAQRIILIGSRQIANSPEITISLRSKYNFKVEVRSCPGADFIVGCRLGINRVSLSDFCNGSPAIKTSIKESTLKLTELFVKPFIIVEDDKNKSVSRTIGCNRDMWMKHSAKRLARLYQAGVATLFSRSKDETAEIIAHLTETECGKGYGIVPEWSEINSRLETRLKFYTSLPGVNIAMALHLCRKYSTLSCFLSSCDSADILMRELPIPKSTALKIYQALHCKTNAR